MAHNFIPKLKTHTIVLGTLNNATTLNYTLNADDLDFLQNQGIMLNNLVVFEIGPKRMRNFPQASISRGVQNIEANMPADYTGLYRVYFSDPNFLCEFQYTKATKKYNIYFRVARAQTIRVVLQINIFSIGVIT